MSVDIRTVPFWRLRNRCKRLIAAGDERGISLIETIVALSLLAVVGSGFAMGMTKTLSLTQDDRLRQQATHLAERELEIARNRFEHADETGQLGVLTSGTLVNWEPLPGQTRGDPLVVDNREFTVRRTSALDLTGTGASPCDGQGPVSYLSVRVVAVVSWEEGTETKSVENRTILTPQKGVEGDVGYLAAKVTNAAGGPANGVSVRANGPANGAGIGPSLPPVDTVDGCAVFSLTNAGTYTFTLDQPGYTNFEGIQTVSKSATLEKGKLSVLPFTYDEAANLTVTYETALGYRPSDSFPDPGDWVPPGVTLFNSGLVGGLMRFDSAASLAAKDLWPFADGYSVWAGTCDQSDPGMNEHGYPRPPATYVPGGSTRNVKVFLAPVRVEVVNEQGVPVPGVLIEGVPQSAAGCVGSDATLSLGYSGSDGVLATSLPAGAWSLQPAQPHACLPESDTCPGVTPQLVVVNGQGEKPNPATPIEVPDVVVGEGVTPP